MSSLYSPTTRSPKVFVSDEDNVPKSSWKKDQKFSCFIDGIPVRILEKFVKKSAQICKIPARVDVKNTLNK